MNERNGSPNGPAITAEDWYGYAVGAAILLLVGVIYAAVSVIMAEPADRLEIVQTLAPFGVAGVALVTFCTVAWRGLISTAQVEAQREQIARISEQIAATEENNLAQLLQKGAELLASEAKAHMAAGIATLQAVITSKNDKFVQEAMELLADYVEERFNDDHSPALCRGAIAAIERGADRGIIANRSLSFAAASDPDGIWQPFEGVSRATYYYGIITDKNKYPEIAITSYTEICFTRCVNMKIDYLFKNCIFERCNISEIGFIGVNDIEFRDCDFSGCETQYKSFDEVTLTGCYYRAGNPPILPPNLMNQLEVRKDNFDDIPF